MKINTQADRYLAEKFELKEKVAKSKAKVKVFEELEQLTTVLKISAPRKMLSVGRQCKLIATGMFHYWIHRTKGVLIEERMGNILQGISK